MNNFLCAVYAFPSIGDINEVRFLLFCLSKYTQFSYHLQNTLCRNTQRAHFQAAVWKRACQSIFGIPSAEKHGCEKNMLYVNWTDQQSAPETSMLVINCKCKTICATQRCSCMSQCLSCTDALIFAKARIKERLYQKEIVKVTMRKKIKT